MAHDLQDVRVRVFQVPKVVQFDVATIGDAIGQHRAPQKCTLETSGTRLDFACANLERAPRP